MLRPLCRPARTLLLSRGTSASRRYFWQRGVSLQRYTYDKLDGSRVFRLLLLKPGQPSDPVEVDLRTASVDRPGFIYEAVSYVWGSASSKIPIRCGGQLAEIGPNLHAALRSLRQPDRDCVLWADALCINQQDLAERAAQVSLMGDVYSRASRTLIHLGEETPDVAHALDGLGLVHQNLIESGLWERLAAASPTDRWVQTWQSLDRQHWNAIAMLVRRPWFSRKWIIQELVLSTDPVVMLGNMFLPYNILEESLQCLAALLDMAMPALGQGNLDFARHMTNIAGLADMRRAAKDTTIALAPLILSSLSFRCTDPRDHVYSLLGLSSEWNRSGGSTSPAAGHDHPRTAAEGACVGAAELLAPDYTISSNETFRRFLQYTIECMRTLDALYLCDLTVAEADTPSWVPPLAALSGAMTVDGETLMIMAGHFCAGGAGQKPVVEMPSRDPARLLVRGRMVDTIEAVGRTTLERSIEYAPHIDTAGVLVNYERTRRWFAERETIARRAIRTASSGRGSRGADAKATDDSDARRLPLSPAETRHLVAALVWARYGDESETEWTEKEALYLKYRAIVEATAGRDEHAVREQLWQSMVKTPGKDAEVLAELHFSEGMNVGRLNGFRALCATAAGRLASVSTAVEVGDRVCVLQGAGLPFVLRPQGDNLYRLVGPGYVTGLMYGEAFEMAGVLDEMIALV